MKIKKIGILLLLCSITTVLLASESIRGEKYSGEDSDGDFYTRQF